MIHHKIIYNQHPTKCKYSKNSFTTLSNEKLFLTLINGNEDDATSHLEARNFYQYITTYQNKYW